MIDWQRLAIEIGSLDSTGEHGSSIFARRALERIVEASEWRAAVDYYVAGGPGAELARSVMWLVHPRAAMERCLELARSDAGTDVRRLAVELLRVVADERAVGWIEELLADQDPGVQGWAAGIVDQVLWSELIEPEEAEHLLALMESHENEVVRDRAEWIRSFLRDRAEG